MLLIESNRKICEIHRNFNLIICLFVCFVQESTQRYSKRRDEQEVEYVADGKTIGKEMRYLAETEDIERDGPQEDVSDWDSLSDRVRKARRQQKTLLQQHRGSFTFFTCQTL